MLHGVRRGVSFADEIVPDGHEPSSIFPRLWAMDYSSNGTVLARTRWGEGVWGADVAVLLRA